ncbi:phosphate acyltransferase PlsX [bacterium]|jgi:glycerol-3-phosphate acyltransferase PlsX|nr:phosphate acyltransferase PlsX [bacterium]
MRLAIDAMGGDDAPGPIVQGALEALSLDAELDLVLVGDEKVIHPLIDGKIDDGKRLSVIHTDQAVGMDESPAVAMRRKPNSSINVCWSLLAEDKVDGVVSAGNTGAVVAGGLMTRRFLPGIQRPGIAVQLPTMTGISILIDAGANLNPKPEHLFQYGMMGASLVRQVYGVENPTIGLMNIGSEDTKGNTLAKETANRFRNSFLRDRFLGNIEGRDICRGLVDVIVCDGFVGNALLKCCEGVLDFVVKRVAMELLGSLDSERQKAEEVLFGLYNQYHHSEIGAAPLMGIDGVCLIGHGGSDARAVKNAIRGAKKYRDVNISIVDDLSNDRNSSPTPAKA